MGVTPHAVYRWKRQYGGLGLNEVREVRQLREENRKLKGIVAGPHAGQARPTGSALKKGPKAREASRLVREIRQAYVWRILDRRRRTLRLEGKRPSRKLTAAS